MKIEFDEKLLDEQDKERIKSIFGNDENLYQKLVLSSLDEYIQLITGRKVCTTIAQQNQFRLFNLITKVFDGQIPSEEKISQFFKIPLSAAHTLLKNTCSTYYFELEQNILSTFQTYLSKALKDKDGLHYTVAFDCDWIVERINALLKRDHPDFEAIKKIETVVQKYKISSSVYDCYK